MEKNPKFLLWTPQHQPTEDQKKEIADYHICYLKEADEALFNRLSNTPADGVELCLLAKKLLSMFSFYDNVVLPIGSPAFIMVLGDLIPNDVKHKIVFAHSERESVDIPQNDGTVVKKSVFKHIKFFNPWS